MIYKAEIYNTLDGTTREYTFKAMNAEHAARKLSAEKETYEITEKLEECTMKTITITMSEENYNYCKSIADEIDACINSEQYHCPYCGEEIEYNPEDEYYMSCPHCNEEIHPEYSSLYEYFADALDIEYTVRKGDSNITGCRIMIAYGGPNVYVDTNDGKVQLYWWNEYAEYPLSREAIDEINEFANELYNC